MHPQLRNIIDLAAFVLGIYLLILWATEARSADPWQLTETRYCGTPVRDASGNIKRSASVLAAFRRIHPCPSTGQRTGACPRWSLNHTIPLSCGGCDSVSNLDWMPDQIKSCPDPWCRDRWERKVYANDPPYPLTGACINLFPVDLTPEAIQ